MVISCYDLGGWNWSQKTDGAGRNNLAQYEWDVPAICEAWIWEWLSVHSRENGGGKSLPCHALWVIGVLRPNWSGERHLHVLSANWHETPSLQLPKHPSVDTRPRAPQGKRSSLQSRRWLPAAAVTRHSGIISRVRTDAFKWTQGWADKDPYQGLTRALFKWLLLRVEACRTSPFPSHGLNGRELGGQGLLPCTEWLLMVSGVAKEAWVIPVGVSTHWTDWALGRSFLSQVHQGHSEVASESMTSDHVRQLQGERWCLPPPREAGPATPSDHSGATVRPGTRHLETWISGSSFHSHGQMSTPSTWAWRRS